MAIKEQSLYDPSMMKLYREAKYRGVLEGATFVSDVKNPSCGDHVIFSGIVEGGILTAIKFSGEGSILSQAFAERLCAEIINKPVEEIMKLNEEDAKRILGLELGLTRQKTIFWVLSVLHAGLTGAKK